MTPDGGYGPFLTRRGRGNVLTHILAAVLAAAVAIGLLLAFNGGSGTGFPGAGAVPSPASSAPPLGKGDQQIVSAVEPGVVIIDTTLQYNSEVAAGTGMVINPDGLVLTNNHVIEDSTAIKATVVATGKTYEATVIGYDESGDIALIQLRDTPRLTVVPVGNSSSVKAGEAVVAMGNAGGGGTIIAAPGQVTGLDRSITASDEAGSTTTETLHGMTQTNADIVAGDSGGPLAGPRGVIGMDTAGSGGGYQQQAIGFAIPINTALSVAREIAAGQASSTVAIGYPAFLGIFIGSGSSSSPQAQAQQQEQQQQSGSAGSAQCYTSNADLTVPSTIAPAGSGTLVDGTICGSPAAQSGMSGGAVITAVNRQAVGSPDELSAILARFHPGDTISVAWVSPSGRLMTSSIRLTAGPPQ